MRPPGDYLAAVRAAFPEQPDKAERVIACESTGATHPATFSLAAAHGGPGQISKVTWERWFLQQYGWTWEQVVRDPETHARALRIIYDRSSGWSPWPVCGLR